MGVAAAGHCLCVRVGEGPKLTKDGVGEVLPVPPKQSQGSAYSGKRVAGCVEKLARLWLCGGVGWAWEMEV